MMNLSKEVKNKLFWNTEESLFGELNAEKPQWSMWKDLGHPKAIDKDFSIRKVVSNNDWNLLLELRIEIEKEFGVTDKDEINELILEIKSVVQDFEAEWFLATYKDHPVGEIGLVSFEYEGFKYGRLLDVDIIPSEQGQGLGNKLLNSIFISALEKDMRALCLKADSDRWVKDWYLRLGFEHVGDWSPNN